MKNSCFVPYPSSFVLKTPAKINWFLSITGKRNDGYHNILSLMQCIGLYDELTFAHADGLDLISDMDIPPEENLVCKAASALGKRVSCDKGAKISLKKNIPSRRRSWRRKQRCRLHSQRAEHAVEIRTRQYGIVFDSR